MEKTGLFLLTNNDLWEELKKRNDAATDKLPGEG